MNKDVYVRGNVLKLYKEYVIETFGQERYDVMMQKLDPENRDIMAKPLLSGEWYPVTAMQDFLNVFDVVIGRRYMKDVAAYTCDKQMKGLYGYVARFFSYKRLVEVSSKLFEKFYKGATVELEKVDESEAIIRIDGMDMPDSQLYGALFYIEHLIQLTREGKIISRPKKFDSNTVRLYYTLL